MKITTIYRVLGVLAVMIIGLSTNTAAQTPTPNPIQAENNNWKGTTDWMIPCAGANCAGQQGAFNRQIEGYASATSVNKGETITFYVNVTDGSPTFRMEIYRMGWYKGDGARLVFSRTGIAGKHQLLPQVNQTTGLIECNWTLGPDAASAYQWAVPTTVVSGVYLVKLINSNNFASYSIFVVRDDARQSDAVFQTSETTWQAYNLYPGNRDTIGPLDPDPTQSGTLYSGKNLYQQTFGFVLPGNSTQAREVSFNRPYGMNNNQIDLTAGQFFSWEYNMVRWLERNGYDVSYISNLDTHTANMASGRFAAGKHKVFISNGHDEYWTWDMRNNIETARNRTSQPMNLAFYSANTMFWQIRMKENSANRIIVGYKNFAKIPNDPNASDPYFNTTDPTDNYLITNRWRDNLGNGGSCPTNVANCYRPPEDEVMGVQYSYPFNSPGIDPDDMGGVCLSGFCPAIGGLELTAQSCPTWACNQMTQTYYGKYDLGYLIGYEADRIFTNHTYSNRSSFLKIGDSGVYNVYNGAEQYTGFNSNLVYFTLSTGAKVFSTGTIQYSWGLDDYSPINNATGQRIHPIHTNNNAQTFAKNMFGCLINGVCQ